MPTLSYRRGSLDYGVLTAQPFGHLRSGRQSIQGRSFGNQRGMEPPYMKGSGRPPHQIPDEPGVLTD